MYTQNCNLYYTRVQCKYMYNVYVYSICDMCIVHIRAYKTTTIHIILRHVVYSHPYPDDKLIFLRTSIRHNIATVPPADDVHATRKMHTRRPTRSNYSKIGRYLKCPITRASLQDKPARARVCV